MSASEGLKKWIESECEKTLRELGYTNKYLVPESLPQAFPFNVRTSSALPVGSPPIFIGRVDENTLAVVSGGKSFLSDNGGNLTEVIEET